MLADKRSESLVNNFASQWFFLNDVEKKDPDLFLFRYFDGVLRSAFERETQLFVGSVLRENRSALELLTANYTYVNERLAEHYGMPAVPGGPDDWIRVEDARSYGRGGLLPMAVFLTQNAPGLRTASAAAARNVAMAISVEITQNFFVCAMSSSGAHSGLSDQAIPMLAVPTVISASERPRSLNIVPATQITIANGIPSAR